MVPQARTGGATSKAQAGSEEGALTEKGSPHLRSAARGTPGKANGVACQGRRRRFWDKNRRPFTGAGVKTLDFDQKRRILICPPARGFCFSGQELNKKQGGEGAAETWWSGRHGGRRPGGKARKARGQGQPKLKKSATSGPPPLRAHRRGDRESISDCCCDPLPDRQLPDKLMCSKLLRTFEPISLGCSLLIVAEKRTFLYLIPFFAHHLG